MELLLILVGLFIAYKVVQWLSKTHVNQAPDETPASSSRPAPRPPSQPSPTGRGDVYRPKSGGAHRRIVFPSTPQSTVTFAGKGALDGLHDAFTGAPLNVTLGLHQCSKCKVYYHSSSLVILRQENSSRCVGCGSTTLVAVSAAEKAAHPGRDHAPEAVTIATYANHFGKVVTFVGYVADVKVSAKGTDYAAMFEHASWKRGFKLVFFRGSVDKVGGAAFIMGLKGRTVRVRGLIIKHPIYGPEIIISERGMILGIA